MKKFSSTANKFIAGFLAAFALIFIFTPQKIFAKGQATRVILVRHGETDYNLKEIYQGFLDIPLNETGIKQAEMLAESLKDEKIDVFISSPMKRAYLTTEKCATLHGKKIAYTDDRLKEINYGDWGGQAKKDIAKKYPEMTKVWKETPWQITFPNGENIRELANRYRAAIEDAVKKYPGKTIFIGAHSKGNRAFICDALELGLMHYNQFEQNNTCVNVLEYKDGQWKLLLMNSIAHTGKLFK